MSPAQTVNSENVLQTPIHPRTAIPPSLETASNLPELKNVLEQLKTRHVAATASLDAAISSHHEVTRQMARLDLTRARLGTLSNSTRALSHGHLSGAASTASKLSTAVSKLDTEQERVKATLAVVEQVSELKSCVLGVVGSMGAPQDWETAAEYMHRASRIPRDVVESAFAEENVPTAEVPELPAQTLDNAAESLCRLFLREFENAVEEGDGARVTRFFKMFPLIGRAREGLDAYGQYVCQGVAVRARQRVQSIKAGQDGMVYVQAWTKLFEHIAQVVDGHGNLVQRHYGTGTLTRVMERLHGEADVQGGIVLDTWWEERSVERKMTEVKSYAYTFLVQSFLPAPGGRGGTNTPRSRSPAPGRRRVETPEPEDDGIDVREIDQLLTEITSMLGPWSLYVRFCSSRAAEAYLDEEAESNELPPLTVPHFITNSNIPRKLERYLTEPFKTFATFILRRSVERAFQLEEKPSGISLNINRTLPPNAPYITSSVDDVMYMVRQVISRALATSQATLVVSVASSVGRVLSSDFIGMIQRKMRDESYPKAAVQGAAPPEDKIITFLVLMNNLDVATTYIQRIVHEHIPDESKPQVNGHSSLPRPLTDLFPLGKEATAVHNSLKGLENTFCTKARDLIDDGITVLYSHVLRPKIQPLLAEMLSTTSYAADEESDTDQSSEERDGEARTAKTVAQRGWDGRVKPLKRILTDTNSKRMMVSTIGNFSNALEKRIWNYQGRVTEVGGVKLERDIADIANVTLVGEDFRLREAFNRCLEIVSVMNMDEEEWDEVEAEEASGQVPEATWSLSSKERHRARTIILGRG